MSIQLEKNRDQLDRLGVREVLSLLVVGEPNGLPVEARVLGVLGDIDEREKVVAFLKKGLSGESMRTTGCVGEPASFVGSVTELLEMASDADESDNLREACAILEAASKQAQATDSKVKRGIAMKLADFSYERGDLPSAVRHYRRSIELLDTTVDRERRQHLFYRLALLLNDIGENEEAGRAMEEALGLESDPEERGRLEEIREAIAANFFVLAQMNYPGVGDRSPGGGKPPEEEEDNRSFEERLKAALADLDELVIHLLRNQEAKGRFPDFLDALPGYQLEANLTREPTLTEVISGVPVPRDPFAKGIPYRYLHLEDPEDFVLYSVGPDRRDDGGELDYDESAGEEGKGDIVRRYIVE